MPPRSRVLLAAAASILMMACASAPATTPTPESAPAPAGAPARPAPQRQTLPDGRRVVESWQGVLPNTPGGKIHMRNNSERPVVITEVTLLRCVNVGILCRTHKTNARILPGQTVVAFSVPAFDPREPGSFSFSFKWEYRDK